MTEIERPPSTTIDGSVDWTKPHKVEMEWLPGERMTISIDGAVAHEITDPRYLVPGKGMHLALQVDENDWPVTGSKDD